MVFYKDTSEYYLDLSEILFFEAQDTTVFAHTRNDVYKVKSKLYQLEDTLPDGFIRVSKSTILNADKVFSLERHITSFSTVEFSGTHKQVFVSRNYLKSLTSRLDERRNHHEI